MKKRSAPRGNYEGKALKHTKTDQKPKGGPLRFRALFLRFVCKNTENLQKKAFLKTRKKSKPQTVKTVIQCTGG